MRGRGREGGEREREREREGERVVELLVIYLPFFGVARDFATTSRNW